MQKNSFERLILKATMVDGIIVVMAALVGGALIISLILMLASLYWGLIALILLLIDVNLFVFYSCFYEDYNKFMDHTSQWIKRIQYPEHDVIVLTYKRFSSFYSLAPRKWDLSKDRCIYNPTRYKQFIIVFSFLDYVRYSHRELKWCLIENANQEAQRKNERNIKSMDEFSKCIKKDLVSFEQENPLNILVEKCRKEDGHV